MKAFYLKDQKQFMNRLLKSELFDHFLMAEATIHSAISYHVDGHINRDFFDTEDFLKNQYRESVDQFLF